MREMNRSRERLAWTGAVVALATSASWLGAISVALAAKQAGVVSPEVLAAGRALLRAAWLLFRHAVPAALLAVLVCGVIALAWARRNEEMSRNGAHHA
jgi:hypothetical protein